MIEKFAQTPRRGTRGKATRIAIAIGIVIVATVLLLAVGLFRASTPESRLAAFRKVDPDNAKLIDRADEAIKSGDLAAAKDLFAQVHEATDGIWSDPPIVVDDLNVRINDAFYGRTPNERMRIRDEAQVLALGRENAHAADLVRTAMRSLDSGDFGQAAADIDKAIDATDGLFSDPPGIILELKHRISQAQVSAITSNSSDAIPGGTLSRDLVDLLKSDPVAGEAVRGALAELAIGNIRKARSLIDEAIAKTGGFFSSRPSIVVDTDRRVFEAEISDDVRVASATLEGGHLRQTIERLADIQETISESNHAHDVNTDDLRTCRNELNRQLLIKVESLLAGDDLVKASDLVVELENNLPGSRAIDTAKSLIRGPTDAAVSSVLPGIAEAVANGDLKKADEGMRQIGQLVYHSKGREVASIKHRLEEKRKEITAAKEERERQQIAANKNWYWRCPNTNTEWRIESSLRQLGNGHYQLTELHRGGEGGSDTWIYRKSGEMYLGVPEQNSGEKRLPFKIDKNGDRIVFWNGKPEQIHYRLKQDAEKFKRGQWTVR